MQDTIDTFYSLPQFIWKEIFHLTTTLGVGLIIAFVTTFYLRRKDERTRVAGVILEKRVNSGQEILFYLERLSFHMELHNGKEKEWYDLLKGFDLTLPHDRNLQYSDVFSSIVTFREFFKGFEEVISRNKLWLDNKTRFHLLLMQAYFSCINALLIGLTRVSLPADNKLIQEELNKLSEIILLQVGITLDHEINGLLAHLETLIVDSVYKLDLNRPKKSITRNGMYNTDTLRVMRKLDEHTLLGSNKEKYFALMILQVYRYKNISLQENDLDELVKETF